MTSQCRRVCVKEREEALLARRVQSARGAVALRLWRLFCLGLAGILWLPAAARALDPNRHISQFGHTLWRTQEGFLYANTTFAQTADGYIMSLGPNGFVRFDGAQFTVLLALRGSEHGRSVGTFFGSSDGTFWIGGSAALVRVRDGKKTIVTSPAKGGPGIGAILEDHSGKIWAARYRLRAGDGALCEVVGDGTRCYGPADGLPAKYAYNFVEDRAGYLWLAGDNLYRWKPGTKATQYFNEFKHAQLVDVAIDHAGNVWAAMDDAGPRFGVQYFHNGIWGEYAAGSFHSSRLKTNALLVDKDGAVWIGTDNDGIYRITGGFVDHFSKSDGLSGRNASSFLEDREGNIWVATEGGVDMFRNLTATNYSEDEGLSSTSATSVLAARDGVIWAGSDNGGDPWPAQKPADILRPRLNQRFGPGPSFPGRIQSLFQDHAGGVWVGLVGSLAVYDHGKVEKVLDKDGQLLHLDSTPAIIEDAAHTIFALSQTHLFLIKDRRLQQKLLLPHALPSLGVLAVHPDGSIFITGAKELMRYKDGVVKDYPLPPVQNAGMKMDLISDSADPLLLATLNGVLRWNGKEWQYLGTENGLPCKRVYSFIKDRHGSLWLESGCGLIRIEASELQRWRNGEKFQISFQAFDVGDGAQTGRPFSNQPQMSLAPDGKVWYANGQTIESIDPDHLFENRLSPPVHVEQVIADGKVYPAGGRLRIPPNPRNLEIDYTATSLTAPQRVQFRYRLEGHDATWQGPLTRRQAFYTDLTPGTYRFHVSACNNSGVWNEVGAVAEFVVAPMFYQTLWFKVVVAVAIAGLLWALYVLRLKRATAIVQKRLLAQMEERERIARELHDTLLQGFQGVVLRVHGLSKTLPAKDPMRGKMESVLDLADEVLLEGRERVRDLRQRTASEDELVARLTKCGQELAQVHDASFSLAVVGTPVVLEATAQDEAYRIAAEALTNAFRHASAGKIQVEITYDSSGLRISVRDDGSGIDKAVLIDGRSGHWGLTGMRERAHTIGAELNLWSRDGAGTEVRLVIPAQIAYPRKQKPVGGEKVVVSQA